MSNFKHALNLFVFRSKSFYPMSGLIIILVVGSFSHFGSSYYLSYQPLRKLNFLDISLVSSLTGTFQRPFTSVSVRRSGPIKSVSISMAMESRKPIIAGNWKMNTDAYSASKLIEEIVSLTESVDGERVELVVMPPYPLISEVSGLLKERKRDGSIRVGAQSCFYEDKGAFTGAISAAMLKSVGCSYVIVGHSERRSIFLESDDDINKIVKKVYSSGMVPILCVGETKEDYELGLNVQTCTLQLSKALKGVSSDDIKKLVIAYEPVWAIGTGLSATPEIAQSVHSEIRDWLEKKYGASVASSVRIQYGGSVTPETVDQLMSCKDIDGALVGGASLKAESFARIANFKPSPSKSIHKKSPLVSLYNFLGESTKSVVSGTAALSLLLSSGSSPVYYVAFGVINAVFSKILKNIIRQPRPPTAPKGEVGFGMPSSHSQALYYFLAVILVKLHHIPLEYKFIRPSYSTPLCLLTITYVLTTSSWRVFSGLHSWSQTIVGGVVGLFVGFLATGLERKLPQFIEQLMFRDVGVGSKAALILSGAFVLYKKELKRLFKK